jgi:tRNA A64-2'-O-ribosylphosphate transferase
MFHAHRTELLSKPKEDLPVLIEKIVQSSTVTVADNIDPLLLQPTAVPETARLYLGVISSPVAQFSSDDLRIITILRDNVETSSLPPMIPDGKELRMTVSDGKKGQMTFIYDLLPLASRLAEEALKAGRSVLVRDHDGKDLSVGVAMVLLWYAYDDDGALRSSPAPKGEALSCSLFPTEKT